MNTKIRYDLDSLELANGDFGYPITEKEVRKVNRMLELMENVRSRHMCPTEGDCVEFVSRSGDYFGKAHIERITGKYADICLICLLYTSDAADDMQCFTVAAYFHRMHVQACLSFYKIHGL